MGKLITNSERKLDNYANSLNNYIVRGGQIKDVHIKNLKLNLNEFKLELDNIHKKPILSTKELSIVFGLSMSWITKMTSKNLIPFYKNSNGNCVFIRKDFEEWLINTEVLEQKFKEYEKFVDSKNTNSQETFEVNSKNMVDLEKDNKTIIERGINYLFVYNENKLMIIDLLLPVQLRNDLDKDAIIGIFNNESDMFEKNIILFKEDNEALSQDEIDNARKQFLDFDHLRTTSINDAEKSYNKFKRNVGLLIGAVVLLIIISIYFFNK